MGLDPGSLDWAEFALRFVAFLPGVHTCIVGSADMENIRRNAGMVSKGALPEDVQAEVTDAFRSHDHDWVGQV
jgi:aryl-alcohol dehydrogenase-like predicted oxidoreductase